MHIKIGTRKSKLALWQANHVSDHLQAQGYNTELVLILSEGDKVLDTPLPMMGGKGVFTKALDDALLNGEIDQRNSLLKKLPKDTLYEVSTWFESGQLKERYTKKNGKWEGEFREWSEDGQLLIISNYSDNKLNGEWKQYFYDDNYTTMSISNFKNNERVGETIYIDL